MDRVRLGKGKVKPVWFGHPWVYRGAVAQVEARGGAGPEDGDLVEVVDPHGNPLGLGWWHGRSALAVRMVPGLDGPPDKAWWAAQLRQARACRDGVVATGERDGWRWINAEGDGLPGVTIDVFGDVVVVAFSSFGAWRRREDLYDAVQEAFGARPPRAIVEAEGGAPPIEGVPAGPRVVRAGPGTDPDAERVEARFEEHGVSYVLPLPGGQKTGFYLDQRDGRARVAGLAAGRRVLDLFCYQGAFALAAAQAGAAAVLGVDSSPPAVAAAQAHAAAAAAARGRRRGAGPGEATVRFEREDVMRHLKAAVERGERHDLVVLDPPPFARRKQHADQALDKLAALHELALRVLAPGGLLLTCSCSAHIGADDLERVVAAAARGAGAGGGAPRRIRVLERRGLPADHPTPPGFAEGRYLHTLLLSAS